MNLSEIAVAVKKATSAIHASEKLAVPVLAAKARKAAQECPEDVGLIIASQVLTKMASNKTFITRAELNNVYESMYTPNSKLSVLFAEELGREELTGPKVFKRSVDEGVSLDRDYEKTADPLLSNALKAAFDGSNQEKIFNPADARLAQKSCMAELVSLGIEPKQVDTFAGKDDVIICSAIYETPSGLSHVLVPVEMKQGRALLPTIFLSEYGFVDLTKEAMEEHIKSTAGKSYKVNGQKLLEVLSAAKNGVKTVVGDIELAAIKLRASKEEAAHDTNGIVMIKVAEEDTGLDLPPVTTTPENIALSQRLVSADGAARFLHNDRIVEQARSMLVRKMSQFGYKNAQVKVADADGGKIHFAISVGSAIGMMVPVKVSDNMVIPPTILIANGMVGAFSKDGVDAVVKGGGDGRVSAVASQFGEMSPRALVEEVKKAVADGNFLKAEDAINVLGEVDKQAQKVAIAILMQSITPESGKKPGEEGKTMSSIANQEVRDVPYTMSYKVFFPEGV